MSHDHPDKTLIQGSIAPPPRKKSRRQRLNDMVEERLQQRREALQNARGSAGPAPITEDVADSLPGGRIDDGGGGTVIRKAMRDSQ